MQRSAAVANVSSAGRCSSLSPCPARRALDAGPRQPSQRSPRGGHSRETTTPAFFAEVIKKTSTELANHLPTVVPSFNVNLRR